MQPVPFEYGPLGEWIELLRLKLADLRTLSAGLEEPMLELSSLLDVLQDSDSSSFLRPHHHTGLLHHLVGAIQAEDLCGQRVTHAAAILEMGLEATASPGQENLAAFYVSLTAALLRAALEELNHDLLPIEQRAADIDDLMRSRSPSTFNVWTVGSPLRAVRHHGDRLAAIAHVLEQIRSKIEAVSLGRPLSLEQFEQLEHSSAIYSMLSERLIHRSLLARAPVAVPAPPHVSANHALGLSQGEAILF